MSDYNDIYNLIEEKVKEAYNRGYDKGFDDAEAARDDVLKEERKAGYHEGLNEAWEYVGKMERLLFSGCFAKVYGKDDFYSVIKKKHPMKLLKNTASMKKAWKLKRLKVKPS